jgi:hypothetical protein
VINTQIVSTAPYLEVDQLIQALYLLNNKEGANSLCFQSVPILLNQLESKIIDESKVKTTRELVTIFKMVSEV